MASDCLIKIGRICGESQDKVYKDHIDVLTFTWGLSNNHTVGNQGGMSRQSTVQVQDLSFSKYVDAASSELVNASCQGTIQPEAKLIVRKSGGGKQLEYFTFLMKDVIVKSVNVRHGGGDDELLMEDVTLSLSEFAFSYRLQDSQGQQMGGTKEVTWDIEANRPGQQRTERPSR